MSEYSMASSGTKLYRSRKNKGYRHICDVEYGRAYPMFSRFVLPGDVWKCGANLLIRYQPTMAPPLTKSWARMRYFFVPLRLVEPNAEKIITGSDNGKLIETTLPTFESFMATAGSSYTEVKKWSLCDYFGFPCIDYENIVNDKSLPRAYWIKGYLRCMFDFYRDENLYTNNDFDTVVSILLNAIGSLKPLSTTLHKDYFTSALPWQLKGVAPTFDINVTNPFQDGLIPVQLGSVLASSSDVVTAGNMYAQNSNPDPMNFTMKMHGTDITGANANVFKAGVYGQSLNSNFTGLGGSFNWADIREMAAQTRIFERLARTGSRYTEYLRANFGTAPADDSLQRAQYLGGFRQPIVTTEVVSTADSSNAAGTVKYPVGTLRGHGISNGGNMIKPFVAKEFGMIFGLLDINPELQYTQGVEREYTYGSRFDFFNPSFQNLSEQEIRNGEIYLDPSDGKNDETFGFQPIYNELRSSRDIVSGDLRDNLSYWTQAIEFASRPNLNENFILSENYQSSFVKPFVITDTDTAKPMVIDCYNIADVYRPMVKESIPGLIDHN